MKSVRTIFSIAALVSVSALTALPNAAAIERMDAEVHTIVIEKLEQALRDAKEDSNFSLAPTRSRLADLYADRARLRALNEAETGCLDCTGAKEDRERALKTYEVVVRESPRAKQGKLLLQMAHLHQLNDRPASAERIYEQVVRGGVKTYGKESVAEAYAGRAERRFTRAEFISAQKDFETAMKLSPVHRRGFYLHRIAWCHLNKGEQPRATQVLVTVLKNRNLMMRQSTQGPVFDPSFQEDVSRDLATFMARGSVSSRDIRTLETLTPDRTKRDNLKYFARELERLGQKHSAIDAWAIVAKYETETADRLEAMIRVAQIRFDLEQRKAALQGMRDAVKFWKKSGCKSAEGDTCSQLQAQLRRLVLDWRKVERKQPTTELFLAFETYLSKFDDDVDMTHWAADTARTLKRHSDAASLYHKTSVLASSQLSRDPKNKELRNTLESSLVGAVEMAELSKNINLRQAAYDHYLKLNPNGAIAAKVQYQRAHVAYERGETSDASRRFNAFATSSHCSGQVASDVRDLCLKAADLDLDSIVALKDHSKVESRAAEYARAFPDRTSEYMRISRTAVLKQVETKSATSALSKLAKTDMSGASQDEQIRFAKTRLSLAEKALDLDETKAAAASLLRVRGLSVEDREFAQGKLAWAAEMGLDFREAYDITRRMKLASMSPADRAMKLSLLAELSGLNARGHDEEFLRVSRDEAKKALVRAKLVKEARSPLREMKQQERYLRPYPALYATVALEIYARTGNVSFAQDALRVRGVARQEAGRVLARQMGLRDFVKLDAQISRHRVNRRSDSHIQRSIQDRMNLLAKVEGMAAESIRSRDWISQLVTLGTLSRENKRFHGDIVALPVPRKLKGKQRDEYVKLVEAQANPYLKKHEEIEAKLSQLWRDSESVDVLTREFQVARPELRGLLARELKMVAAVAPSSARRQIESELKNAGEMPSAKEIASAKADVRARPFNARRIEKLKSLELSRGKETMVAYLDARLTKLKEEGETR